MDCEEYDEEKVVQRELVLCEESRPTQDSHEGEEYLVLHQDHFLLFVCIMLDFLLVAHEDHRLSGYLREETEKRVDVVEV